MHCNTIAPHPGIYFKLTYIPISTQASELLRDMTLGANMRVHLVRMIILLEPEVSSSLFQLEFSPVKLKN